MLAYIVWLTGIAFEIALLIRGAVAGLVKRYPLFYTYIGCVLIKELVGFGSYILAPNSYAIIYWPTELVTVMASFAIIIQIFRAAVKHNPGMVRFIQNVLLISFCATTLYACVDFSNRGFTSIYRAIEGLGRDLRFVEGALLVMLLWLLMRYRISLGRNLSGLVVGYSFWVGINLTYFAFLPAPGDKSASQVLVRALISGSYTMTLAIWCWTLWSQHAEPFRPSVQLEHDYEFIASRTRSVLARTSNRVARAMKP